MPELIERRVQIEIHPNRDALSKLRIGEQARDVDENVGAAGRLAEPAVRHPDRGLGPRQHQG
jgi:hypothetical protein